MVDVSTKSKLEKRRLKQIQRRLTGILTCGKTTTGYRAQAMSDFRRALEDEGIFDLLPAQERYEILLWSNLWRQGHFTP